MAVSEQDIQFSAQCFSGESFMPNYLKANRILDEVIKDCNYDSNLVFARYKDHYQTSFVTVRKQIEDELNELVKNPEGYEAQINELQETLRYCSDEYLKEELEDLKLEIQIRIDLIKPKSSPTLKF